MVIKNSIKLALGCVLLAGLVTAQDPNQPPPNGDAQQAPSPQYPPQGQYPQPPQQQGQYPQYPPPQQTGQPPQGQYPQGQYPQGQNGQGWPTQYPSYPPQQYPAPAPIPPGQLRQLVSPVALYPDGLLAQVLTASTYGNQIPEAAGWANAHQYLHGDALADAIRADNLAFDPSVMALLPFPSVLNYMAQYSAWTQALGNAVLTERPQLMDTVQQLRQESYNYGYLRSNQYERVEATPGAIEIVPVNPGFYFVPYYNPVIVFGPPRPGFFVGGAIRFGGGITIGAAFAPFGWSHVGFGWHDHAILIDNRPWDRRWDNRAVYAHPYATPYRRVEGPRVEHHERDEHHR